MNKKSLYILLAAAVVIGLLVLLIRIVSGAVSIVSGGFNAVLGLAVIAALVIIVVWMFAYAKKSRKK
jgi:O-antigen ligase